MILIKSKILMKNFFTNIFVAGLCLIACASSGCAVNPVTGRTQLMLVSEEEGI
jgi:hypothetical protein